MLRIEVLAYCILVMTVCLPRESTCNPLFEGSDTNGLLSREKRTAVYSDDNLWPNGVIPFTYAGDLSLSDFYVEAVHESMQHFEEKTCIRFVHLNRTQEEKYGKKFVRIIRGSHCHSSVGMAEGLGAQALSISKKCAYPDMIIHELGHLVGLWHEHARYDRDSNIVILWRNVEYKHNFDKVNRMRLLAPYDLSSMMHYGDKTFSATGEPTFYPVDQDMAFVIGYRRDLSFYDSYSINKLYKCADHCGEKAPVCENQGYLNQNCRCVCPKGLRGKRCHRVKTQKGCGGVLNVSGKRRITTPNFPGNYSNNMDCSWLLKTSPGRVLQLSVDRDRGGKGELFDLERSAAGLCRDSLEVRYHHIGVDRGPTFCGTVFDKEITSLSNFMMVHFVSNSRFTRSGFKATVTAVSKTDCQSSPCEHGGSCEELPDIDTYTCHCASGFVGRHCDIQIVDGAWSEWSEWSKCVASCGRRWRSRSCNDPAPQNGGDQCQGGTSETDKCGDSFSCGVGFSCDFGDMSHPENCSMHHTLVDVALEWSEHSGPTESMHTGPTSGHTTGEISDRYIYLEASLGDPFDSARFWLPKTTWRPNIYCLQFFYHLHGGAMGSLMVKRQMSTSPFPAVVWQHSGQHGENWREANIDVVLYEGVTIGFVAVRGDAYESDIALDDISVSPGSCDRPPQPHRCTLGKRRYQPGPFRYFEGCYQVLCFCNHDGYVDCPVWRREDICRVFGVSMPSELRKKQRTLYRLLVQSTSGNRNNEKSAGEDPAKQKPKKDLPLRPVSQKDNQIIQNPDGQPYPPSPKRREPGKAVPSSGWKPKGPRKQRMKI